MKTQRYDNVNVLRTWWIIKVYDAIADGYCLHYPTKRNTIVPAANGITVRGFRHAKEVSINAREAEASIAFVNSLCLAQLPD